MTDQLFAVLTTYDDPDGNKCWSFRGAHSTREGANAIADRAMAEYTAKAEEVRRLRIDRNAGVDHPVFALPIFRFNGDGESDTYIEIVQKYDGYDEYSRAPEPWARVVPLTLGELVCWQ